MLLRPGSVDCQYNSWKATLLIVLWIKPASGQLRLLSSRSNMATNQFETILWIPESAIRSQRFITAGRKTENTKLAGHEFKSRVEVERAWARARRPGPKFSKRLEVGSNSNFSILMGKNLGLEAGKRAILTGLGSLGLNTQSSSLNNLGSFRL